MHYVPQYFGSQELVSPACHARLVARGMLGRVWTLFDWRILWAADQLRELYGPLVCNDWQWRGEAGHKQRGFRLPSTDIGAEFSQHRFGRALDLVPVQVTAAEIREDMRTHPDREAYRHITGVEDDVSWLHIDCRNWPVAVTGIMFFKP